jgi:hypothetical protein
LSTLVGVPSTAPIARRGKLSGNSRDIFATRSGPRRVPSTADTGARPEMGCGPHALSCNLLGVYYRTARDKRDEHPGTPRLRWSVRSAP